MLKNITKLEVKMGERVYQLLCEVDSPLGELYDVLSMIKGFVLQKMQEIDEVKKEDEQNG